MSRMHVRATLEGSLSTMRPSEAEVARRLLRDLGCVASGSLRDVAASCGTSDATVVRACRAAGYDGFQDLKYNVLRELTSAGAAVPRPGSLIGHLDYADDIEAGLEASAAALPKAARLLRCASRVVLVGIGASHGIGLILNDVLFTLGKQALAVSDAQMLTFALTPPVKGLVLLAISHSGESQFPVRAIREARGAGVPTIGLSNEPASELAWGVDVFLPTQTVEPPEGSFSIGPRICQLAVLDRLVGCLKTGRRSLGSAPS